MNSTRNEPGAAQASTARSFGERLKDKVTRIRLRFLYANWCLGKLVELAGNRVRIDGCTFDVDNPDVRTKYKSSLLTGVYEREERLLLRKYPPSHRPVIELGACIGVVSCLTNLALENPGDHLVVEANPRLLPTLERNREVNGCQFEILNSAVHYGAETATLFIGDEFQGNSTHVERGKRVSVPAVRLSKLIAERGWKDVFLVCDIEGGESDLIREEIETLRESVEWIIIEMHEHVLGRAGILRLCDLLESNGFNEIETESDVFVFRRAP